VSVPDKGTLLLGGQRLVGEIEKESGVPVLSKIPIINRLFTNRSKVRDEKTLLILIKPTIIIQGEEEEKLFPGLMQAPGLYAD
jgi:type II secretory pathway component GspD/PulD (secretin)